uniref:V-type proton ATPase subunit G n=1 Tax=Podarcis muralis TaxID=64176 RepID=A0A670IW78_PODMU
MKERLCRNNINLYCTVMPAESPLPFVFPGKGKRLKQAKEEATAEIDHYRLQREKDFRHKQSTIMGSQGNLSTKIDEETTAKIRDLTSNYHKNMESVIGRLLDEVYHIDPELHANYAYTI